MHESSTMFSDRQNSDSAQQNTLSCGTIYPVAFLEVAIEVQNLVSIPE
ncbi:MAG: hypothetical protein AAF773_18990 [Cyanobacteria bacterium P01_D01_bin.115]